MSEQHTPYPPGYLAYGSLNHVIEREHICDLCGAKFKAHINAKTCPACKTTPVYRERKRAMTRRHSRAYRSRRRAVA